LRKNNRQYGKPDDRGDKAGNRIADAISVNVHVSILSARALPLADWTGHYFPPIQHW
jgi:hypothetical protein